ncbi:prenylcysteine lyase, putative [Sugiyamaella lignohabitans]|uniref:Prenylcysteine lyase, putative n=1 Tax=Sugiyamaella lignohabitans TaxID=796027 RepID=A0A167FMZ6_9ASCO|nr:prenylcysteine lyase, putative [Sugiyamaella lignohabitans]ANB15495.1 prenylcysteine lyase, putative [Sugiyamaella lignohabitans]
MFQQILSLIGSFNLGNNGLVPNLVSQQTEVLPLNASIAIIGAGAGGSSAAYHLSNYSRHQVDVTIFDKNDYIGGRVKTIEIEGESYELGGSIFVTVNSLLIEGAEQFNLNISTPEEPEGNNSTVSVWDGQELIYDFPRGWSWWKGILFLKDFGLSPLYATYYMRTTIGKFLQLYEEPLFPWSSLTTVVDEVGLTELIGTDSRTWLNKNTSVGTKFQDTILQALTRVNYASNLDHIHSLAAMVCLAAEDGVRQIVGGNNQIFHNWVKASGAYVKLNHPVSNIVKSNEGWLVDGNYFDYVILAAPFAHSDLSIISGTHGEDVHLIETEKLIPDVPYVELHVTFVLSKEKIDGGNYFGKYGYSYGTILTTTTPPYAEPQFLSLSQEGTTEKGHYVYKLFSYEDLSDEQLIDIFGWVKTPKTLLKVWRKTWYSYPKMQPVSELANIEIAPNLFYTSGMDPFISTMETNALSGKNIAKLLQARIYNKQNNQ